MVFLFLSHGAPSNPRGLPHGIFKEEDGAVSMLEKSDAIEFEGNPIDISYIAPCRDGSLYILASVVWGDRPANNRLALVLSWAPGQSVAGYVAGVFADVSGFAVSVDGALYISEENEHRVVRLDPARPGEQWKLAVVAGGDGRGSTLTKLCMPGDIAIDSDGGLYIADRGNRRIVKWCLRGHISLWIEVVAAGLSSHDLHGISLDMQGGLYVCDDDVYHWAVGATSGDVVKLLAQHRKSSPVICAWSCCAIDDKGRLLATYDDSFTGNNSVLLEPSCSDVITLHEGCFSSLIAVSKLLWNHNSHKHFPRWLRDWAVFVSWWLVHSERAPLDTMLAGNIIAYALDYFLSVPSHFVGAEPDPDSESMHT